MKKSIAILLCAILLGIAVLMTIAIYFAFWNLLRLQFSPGYAAFTFPMAIGATALYKSSALVAGIPGGEEYAAQLHVLATIELVISALVICYVLILYIKNLNFFFISESH